MKYRIGIGTDLHKLDANSPKPLVIGGVEIPADFGVIAHSDGDVLIHAICDALLGALGLGDIGELYPDNDPANKNKDSAQFLSEILATLENQEYNIQNLDCVIHLQKPKLKDYKPKIRENIARILKVQINDVNIKAKTREHVDAVGQSLAVEAFASVLIYKTDK